MKVLLAFPQQDKQTGLFITRAFKQLNCSVITLDPKIEPHNLFKMIQKNQPDIIFCSRTPELLPGISKSKREYPNIPIGCWNVDVRSSVQQFGPTLLNLFKQVDILYTIAIGNINEYQQRCPNTIIKHLQQGCDPLTHKREKLTEQDHQKYDCDVMFAGGYKSTIHHGRIELIEYLKKQDLNFKLYGYKNHITDTEQNKANRCAKIVLGNSGWPKLGISMSVREYKIMASSGFLLAQYCKDIEYWFKIGEECDVYKSKEECLEKIRYYLEHDYERRCIAENGYNIVHKNHKYLDRIKIVLKDLLTLKN